MRAVTSAPASPSDERWRIVVIDDDPDDRANVRRLLLRGSQRRYDFIEADTGKDGIRAILEAPDGPPACAILDYRLRDCDATDVLAGLAGPDEAPVCPVVVITGSDGQEVGRAVLRAGAQDFAGKGWMTAESLTRAVENAVERWAMARELRAALEETRRAVLVRDQLMSLVSHDLKSPLSVLTMSMSRLECKVRDEGRDTLRRMMRQTQRMNEMIDELLDVSRIHAGMPLLLERNVTDLVEVTRALAGEFQDVAPNHRIEVWSATESLIGNWDLKRINRMVNNLLSNAVKYSPGGGRVHVNLEAENDGTMTWAVLRITDEGIGISPNDRARIFEWHVRGENARRTSIQGTGIGLAGVREIIEQLGGSISVESQEGKGSTFTVRLPTELPLSLPLL